jgi:molecular chaperone HscB
MADLEALRQARDAFEVFGFPRTFSIDPAELDRRFAELSRQTHPDLAGDDAEKQIEAMDLSAKVNGAQRLLSDKESRANLLLELLGGPSREADKRLPEGFLPIIMMVREELADAQLEGDDERVNSIEDDAKAQQAARLAEIGRLFERHATEENLKNIRLELNALRYYQRLLEQVRGEPREM